MTLLWQRPPNKSVSRTPTGFNSIAQGKRGTSAALGPRSKNHPCPEGATGSGLSLVRRLSPFFGVPDIPPMTCRTRSRNLSLGLGVIRSRLPANGAGKVAGNSHFASLVVFGVHPLGCQQPANTLKSGHQTGLDRQNENC